MDFNLWCEAALKKHLMRQYPNIPSYVKRDVINNGPGGAYAHFKRKNRLDQFQLDKGRLEDLNTMAWSKKPQIVQVTPMSFDTQSLQYMTRQKFGYMRADVTKDLERTNKQREIARGDGSNEPVAYLLDHYNKYVIIEGWHRTIAILLLGCPPDQLTLLKDINVYTGHFDPQKNLSKLLDYSKWAPVKINAYFATRALEDQQHL